jgi:pimeloyl-ACP methyl ester carboxylesterase
MGFWNKLRGLFGGRETESDRGDEASEEDKPKTELVAHRDNGAKAAIVFVHGFGGSAKSTWGGFPDFLASDPRLNEWDIFNLGYNTGLAPDILARIWTADPSITELSQFLSAQTSSSRMKDYEALVVVAHSMGGLVAQRAVVDDATLRARLTHLFLFGTPSGGLSKASMGRFWKRQLRDMADDGEFISRLTQDRDQLLTDPGFCLFVVAGDKDEFVPDDSSLGPFPTAELGGGCVDGVGVQKRVVAGNHLEIVKPQEEGTGRLPVDIVIEGIVGGAAASGPASSARVAVAQGEFQKVIDSWGEHADELDQDALVDLALAYEFRGDKARAMEILETRPELSTDAMGVLAGRYKRRWRMDRRQADGDRALELYTQAYEIADGTGVHAQAYYLGVNVAFMHLVYTKRQDEMTAMAQAVLNHTGQAPEDMWNLASQGEALLYQGDTEAALAAYGSAIAKNPDPRQLESMYSQAAAIADHLDDSELSSAIEEAFGRRTMAPTTGN